MPYLMFSRHESHLEGRKLTGWLMVWNESTDQRSAEPSRGNTSGDVGRERVRIAGIRGPAVVAVATGVLPRGGCIDRRLLAAQVILAARFFLALAVFLLAPNCDLSRRPRTNQQKDSNERT